MIEVLNFVKDHGLELVGGFTLTLSGLYAIALIIPGEQPDKFIKSVLDITTKLSKK